MIFAGVLKNSCTHTKKIKYILRNTRSKVSFEDTENCAEYSGLMSLELYVIGFGTSSYLRAELMQDNLCPKKTSLLTTLDDWSKTSTSQNE
jgi:hypothetical protein